MIIRTQTLVVKILLSFISFGCFLSCASQHKATNQTAATDVITATLGKNISFTENESKTYLLYQQKPEGDHVNRQFNYVVVKKSTNKIVLEGNYRLGYVKWHDNTSIEVLSLPSLSEQDESKFKKVISVIIENQ